MSLFDDDQFLKDLYEEPRGAFVEALWDELTTEESSAAPVAEAWPTDAQRPFMPEERVMIEHTHHRRNGAQLAKSYDRHYRRSWAATFLMLGLGLVIVLAAAHWWGVDTGTIHLSDLGAQQLTPTAFSTPMSTPTTTNEVTIHDALLPGERPLPAAQFDLGGGEHPTDFSLSAEQPAVRLRLDGQVNSKVTIMLELATYVPQTGIAVRLSRYTGLEIQPLMIFKPEYLVSLPVNFPIAFVDTQQKADVIVELLTPLAPGKELAFRAYTGAPWPLPTIQTIARGVSCVDYPIYCVPLIGDGTDTFAVLESPSSRLLDQPSTGASGVIRGISPSNSPIIGDPAAPLHLTVFLDFSSTREADYYLNDLQAFITDYVLTGQAYLELVLLPDPDEKSALAAAQAAYLAGEQGAFWEMTAELFELAKYGGGPRYAFDWLTIYGRAERIGLDAEPMIEYPLSNHYDALFNQFRQWAEARGIDEIPAILFETTRGDWQPLPDHSYAALAQAARAPELLEQARPVVLVLDPDRGYRIAYGLQEGDHIQLRFDLNPLGSGQTVFEGSLVSVGWETSQQDGPLVYIIAVSPQDAATVVSLLDAGVALDVHLID